MIIIIFSIDKEGGGGRKKNTGSALAGGGGGGGGQNMSGVGHAASVGNDDTVIHRYSLKSDNAFNTMIQY